MHHPRFKALVRYRQPAHDELCAQFDWVSPTYARFFFTPIDRCKDVDRDEAEITFEYLCLEDKVYTTNEVLAEMDKQGFRPAVYEELLAFAVAYPNEQRKHPIAALGSVDVRCIACLDSSRGNRNLRVGWTFFVWSDIYRFLAVRK